MLESDKASRNVSIPLSSQSHSSSIECAGFWPSWFRKETGGESSRETMPNARPGGTEQFGLMEESVVLR